MPGVIRRVGRAVEGTGLENRRAQAPWVRIPHSPPYRKKEGRKALFCAGFQETAASAGVMPQGAAVCGDRGGQINRGPRKSAAFVGNQTGVRKHRGFESHTLRQRKKGPLGPFLFLYREKFRACGRGAFVHFPPAESGQKGRRGAFLPKAKCPPEPPVRPRRGWLLQYPSPASAAGLRFSSEEAFVPRGAWLPCVRGAGKPEGFD